MNPFELGHPFENVLREGHPHQGDLGLRRIFFHLLPVRADHEIRLGDILFQQSFILLDEPGIEEQYFFLRPRNLLRIFL
jgi:hypothetical protein